EIARRRALVNIVQDARPKPTPALILGINVERASAESKNTLQNLQSGTEAFGAGEGPIELDAAPARIAGEFNARKRLPNSNLQIRECLVVLQIDIEARLNVLHEARFQQECVHLRVRGNEVDVGDQLDQVRRARVLGRRPGEVVAGPVTQILRLPHVKHAALTILHEVDARSGWKLL